MKIPKKLIRWLIYLSVAIVFVALLWMYNAPQTKRMISITTVAADVRNGKVERIVVNGNNRSLVVSYKDNIAAYSQIGGNSSLEEILATYGVDGETYKEHSIEIIYESSSELGRYIAPLFSLLSALFIMGFIYFLFRQSQGNSSQTNSFGKSRARLFTTDHPTVSFSDVAGVDEAKQELKEVVDFLKDPNKFINFGARIPKGVLLVGHPGTGKTLLAKAVAGEARVPFFSIAGSEFVEMYVGVGASRVRDLFDQAKRQSPCIIFIDEIDAVGRHRGAGLGGGHDEREQTLNQILVEMDGFSTDNRVIILAATNRPDILDPALLRPGRFDRRVIIDRPDIKGREQIFRIHLRGKPLGRVDLTMLAKSTPGFSGAEIENTVNEAALLTARRNRPTISMKELQEAIERVQLGPERKSRVISQAERTLVAYHEAGHAVAAYYSADALPIRKITIIPRGQAGGLTWYMQDDLSFITRSRCKALIITALGGRVAEELIFNEVTTGAQNDLQQITKIAQAMVTQYGMSEQLGLRVYGEKQEMVFLGREIGEKRDYSDAVAEQIDAEIGRIIDNAYQETTRLLSERREQLELVAKTLLDVESLDLEQFTALMATGKLPNAPQPKNNPNQSDPFNTVSPNNPSDLPTSPSLA